MNSVSDAQLSIAVVSTSSPLQDMSQDHALDQGFEVATIKSDIASLCSVSNWRRMNSTDSSADATIVCR
jgi:hypothetical protein